jgi:hypothetical protein
MSDEMALMPAGIGGAKQGPGGERLRGRRSSIRIVHQFRFTLDHRHHHDPGEPTVSIEGVHASFSLLTREST